MIPENRGFVFLSLVLAVGIWFHAKTEEIYTLRRPVVLDVQGLDESRYAIVKITPETLWIEMQDHGKVLLLHAFAPLPHYTLKLRQVREGRNVIPLSLSHLDFSADPPPKSATLVPSSILLQIDRKVSRREPIQIPVQLPDSLQILSMEVRPPRARIIAPQSVLDTLTVLVAETLHIHQQGTFQFSIRLLAPPKSDVDPETVQVNLQIGKALRINQSAP